MAMPRAVSIAARWVPKTFVGLDAPAALTAQPCGCGTTCWFLFIGFLNIQLFASGIVFGLLSGPLGTPESHIAVLDASSKYLAVLEFCTPDESNACNPKVDAIFHLSSLNSQARTDMADQTLGSGLKLARQLRKLSLRDVEDAVGISNPYLSQLENNKVMKPSPFYLHKLAGLYGIEYETLMEAAGYVQKRVSQEGAPKTLAGAALFSQEKLTAEEEEQLANYLHFLRSKSK